MQSHLSMRRFHSSKKLGSYSELSSAADKSKQLRHYRELKKPIIAVFHIASLPDVSGIANVSMTGARFEGRRKKSASRDREILQSAFEEFFKFPTLGLFSARLSFQWKGTNQRKNMGCSASYGFFEGKGHFRISFRPEIPKPYTVADLKEAPEVLQALGDLGFGTFSREELIANEPGESPVYFNRDQIVVQIAEITPDAVDRMFAVAEQFGSGKILESLWSFQTSLIKPSSEDANRLTRQLTKDKPDADEYEVELGYRIEKLEDYELPRAFCVEGEEFPHPIAEFKLGQKKCLLSVQVSKEGYRFGLHTNEALSEGQFDEIEKTLGIEFEREPCRKT